MFKQLFFFIFIFLIFFETEASSKKKTSSLVKLIDTTLFEGLKYQKYKVGERQNQFIANVLRLDLNNRNLSLDILKSNNLYNHVSKINEIIRYNDSIDNKYTIAAINANFWKAYSNKPIGTLIKNGKVIELKSYKEWSSIFFDENNIPYIDNFKVNCILEINKKKYNISEFNSRKDSNQIVIYNSFAGKSIPFINGYDIENTYKQLLFEKALLETYDDSTESDIEFNNLLEIAKNLELNKSIENKINKILLTKINDETINSPVKFIVEKIDTGIIDLNENQHIISPGLNNYLFEYPKLNDTVSITIHTNYLQDKIFINALTGTPRLVRNGKAVNEAKKEGLKSKRFIYRKLARTVFGVDKNKKEIILVTIPTKSLNNMSNGANLSQLATFMKLIGAYNSINLDGGGSSMMIINGFNIDNPIITNMTRRISGAIGIRINKGEK